MSTFTAKSPTTQKICSLSFLGEKDDNQGFTYMFHGQDHSYVLCSPEQVTKLSLVDHFPVAETNNFVLYLEDGQYVHKEELKHVQSYSDSYAVFAGLPNSDHIHSLIPSKSSCCGFRKKFYDVHSSNKS